MNCNTNDKEPAKYEAEKKCQWQKDHLVQRSGRRVAAQGTEQVERDKVRKVGRETGHGDLKSLGKKFEFYSNSRRKLLESFRKGAA